MGTSICDVTMTLKKQEKNGNIFFLKKDSFFYKNMYVWHFTQTLPRDYTAAFTSTQKNRHNETVLLSTYLQVNSDE